MKPTYPLCCSPRAFALLSKQVPQLETPDALLHSAIAVATHHMKEVDVGRVEGQLQGFVDTVRGRVRGRQPQALLAHLHEVLFGEEGFTGNSDDYYNPANSYLPAVLETKKGLPITLCLIYKTVAERLGFDVWGVGLPGHFLVGMNFEGSRLLVDPFCGGRLVTEAEAEERIKAIFGEGVEWNEQLLSPTPNRHWLTRMLQNLLNLFGSNSSYADVGAILEMEMLLWPEQERLQRDLALVLARIGLSQPASAWLDHYLRNNPDDPQQTDLRQLLEVLNT